MKESHAIYIRNKNGNLLGRVHDYVTLKMLMTLNDPGSWSMSSITKDKCPFSAGDGIIDVRNGKFFYGGILTSISDEYDAVSGLYRWTISGKGDLEYLNRRLCYVDPASGSTTTKTHYTATDSLSTVVNDLIRLNVGVNALGTRREYIIADSPSVSFTPQVSVSLRFQNLLQVLVALVSSNGWNIRANWDDRTHKIFYDIYEGRDLTRSVIFTEQLNNIISSEYLASVPEGNYIIAGGSGEGRSRTFSYASNSDSVETWGRIELFQDGRNQNSLSDFANETLSANSENNIGYSCVASSIDLAPQYGIDYELGDFVGMKVHGEFVTAEVQQCEITVEGGIEKVEPRFGTVAIGKLNDIFKQLRDLRKDVNELLGTEVE